MVIISRSETAPLGSLSSLEPLLVAADNFLFKKKLLLL